MAHDEAQKSLIAKREEEILEFWHKNNIFKKSLEKDAPGGDFVFYDGPPFATGTPHYGHILAGTMKDVIPRFWTMRGKRVLRRWGWDCHGLPIENLIEKELGLKNKKDIEEYGIEKFNNAARASVLRYDKEWKRIVPRSGRWVDMDNAYLTMDPPYMESVWWSFKAMYEKDLIYQGFKSMYICPRCETTLANFEVSQGYKDITDISVYVKFDLVDEPGTYLLAWTTTPWTLPGNAALAVNSDVAYAKIRVGDDLLIVGKERLSVVKEEYEVVSEMKGNELVGKQYVPLFDYYAKGDIKNKENGWKIYSDDFVTTQDGTGIVHIAPAFGEDDYQLSLKHDIPFIQHVDISGTFKDEVTDFAGMLVRPKDDHQRADVEIIKYLAHRGNLFAKEKIVHAYPHCWRCDTPLLNYAASSWFVKVSALKDAMRRENKKVTWIPEEIGQGRFDKGIEAAPDWAISRSRYWGSTLPVWRCEQCEKEKVLGSVEELKQYTSRGNTFLFLRHGEAEHNVKGICSGKEDDQCHLTERGKEQAQGAAEMLKEKQIEEIYVSPFLRAQETAHIIAGVLGISKDKIKTDERLREFRWGDLDGKPYEEFLAYEKAHMHTYDTPLPNGESYQDAKNRTGDFMYEIDAMHTNKNILVIAHGLQAEVSRAVAEGADKIRSKQIVNTENPAVGEIVTIPFAALPHNSDYELDLHRPYIDRIEFPCETCAGTMKKITEVFDTWYESGSMPYGQHHYPFENTSNFNPQKEVRFPADFIAEGVDQTRGWFYTLLTLSVGLFGRAPYKHVVVNGIVLAEDGQKMSKRLKNYPEIDYIFDRYGADAMRYYLISAPVVRAEDLAFSERGVDEVAKKIIMRLQNVYSFYEMYKSADEVKANVALESDNVLDQWIVRRLNELGEAVTHHLERYELDRAARPIALFVDDLSTWYLRRSRDRFKGNEKDRKSALATIRYVLKETAKIIAPFMPFLAEDVFQKIREHDNAESVHLERWSEYTQKGKGGADIISDMTEVREIVSQGLEARSKAGIKVRQPLQELTIKNVSLSSKKDLIDLIKDEVNVKEVVIDPALSEGVVLDTTITEELRKEGYIRDLIRTVQDMRKKAGLTPDQPITLIVDTSQEGKSLIEEFKLMLSRPTSVTKINFGRTEGETVSFGELTFTLGVVQ